MAGTFSQIYIQVVFAVQGRESLLQKPWREEVFKYINDQKFVRGKFSWQEGFGSYLIGMKNNITPSGFMVRICNFFYNHFSPSGLRNRCGLFLEIYPENFIR